MSLMTYKILHILGMILLFFGLGAILISQASGANLKSKAKVIAYAFHGVGLLILLVSGFGQLARLGITSGIPQWAYVKLVVWGALGIGISLAKRKSQWTFLLSLAFAGLGVLAASMALLKPF